MEVLIEISEVTAENGRRRAVFKSSLDKQDRELANPLDEVQDALVRWYLEEHPMNDPLERKKASLAEIELKRYGSRINHEVGLDGQSVSAKSGEISVKIHQDHHSGVSGHALLWEALEGTDGEERGGSGDPPVVVSRLVTPNVHIPPLRQIGAGPFRILLVVGRVDMTEENHRIIATTLLRIANATGLGRIEVEMVRPGTFDELRNHLHRRRTRSRPVDLVHFDLHGVVWPEKNKETGRTEFESYLKFFPQNETGTGLHKASKIAALLYQHRVPMVVINACESARSDRGPLANLAHVFVRNGIPMVLAMSYKLQVDALAIFFGSFYRSLLQRGRDFCQSAADGRKAMRLNKKRRGRLGLELELLDWVVPTAYTASGLVFASRTPAISSAPVRVGLRCASVPTPELISIDPSFDMEVLNLETRLCDPWQCGAGPVVNVCGFDGIGKHTFLQHCQQWWTQTSFFDRILTYTHPRGEAYPTAKEIQAWMASQLEQDKDLSEVCADEVVAEWVGTGRTRKRLLVILENFSAFKIDEGRPKRSLSLQEEQNWHHLFKWMDEKKIWAVVSSTSKLMLVSEYPSEDDEDHLFPVDTKKYKGGQETPINSPYYYLPATRNAPTKTGRSGTFYSWLNNSDEISGMKTLVDCLAGLPRLVELAFDDEALDTKVVGKSTADVVTYLTSGHDLFRQGEGFKRQLYAADPIFGLLDNYFNQQAPLSKVVLFSFSFFTKYLGRKMEPYCADFVVHFAYSISSNPSWASQLARLDLGLPEVATIRDLLPDQLRGVIWDLSALGLLRKDFFFIEVESEGSTNESTSIPPLYRVHPYLTIFLRRRLTKVISQIAPDEASGTAIRRELNMPFIRYHLARIGEWSAVEDQSAVFLHLSKFLEQEEEMLNFFGALGMWLEEDVNHRDYSYPKRLFNNFYAPFPRLTNGIEANKLAPFVSRLQTRLGQVFEELELESRPPHGGWVRWMIHRLNIFQCHRKPSQAMENNRLRTRWQYYAALTFYLRLSNWLVYYYVIHGKPESAAEQISRCRHAVSTHLTPYRSHSPIFGLQFLSPSFSGARPTRASDGPPKLAQELYMINNTTGLNQEEQIVHLISSRLQRARSMTLQSWTRASEENDRRLEAFEAWLRDTQDEVLRPWVTTGLELLKSGWGQKRNVETWGYRTREEVQTVSAEAQAELRRAFIAVAGIPRSAFDRLFERGTRTLSRILRRLIGSRIHDDPPSNTNTNSSIEEALRGRLVNLLATLFGGTASDATEFLKEFGKVVENFPGMEGLMELWGILKGGFGELRAGTSPEKVFDDFYPQIAAIDAQFWWRRTLVWMLAFSLDSNELFKLMSAHQLLIKSYMDRGDWEGLDQHLCNIDLEAEQGGKCQWYAVRGICSLHLSRWEESGTYLKKSLGELSVKKRDEYMLGNFGIFGLAGGFTIQFTLLRFMIALKYGGGEEHTPELLPAWAIFLEALGLGYGAPMGLLYRWNGSILEQLCQHYLEPPGLHRDPGRVINMPAQAEYGAAIRDYVLPSGLEEGMDTIEIDKHQLPLYLILEFLHRKRARSEIEYEELADFDGSKAFFDFCTRSGRTLKLRLSRGSASVVFLESLKLELAEQWEKRLDVLETFEQFLMGKSLAGIPEGLARMSDCLVIELAQGDGANE